MINRDDAAMPVKGECIRIAEFGGCELEVRGKRFKNYFLPGFSVEIRLGDAIIFASEMEFFPKNELKSQEEAVGFCDSESAEWGETAYQLFHRRKKRFPIDAIALCEEISKVDVSVMTEKPGLLAACLDLSLQAQRTLYPRKKCEYIVYFGNPADNEDNPFPDRDTEFKKLCKRDKVTIVECTQGMAVAPGCFLATRKASDAIAQLTAACST